MTERNRAAAPSLPIRLVTNVCLLAILALATLPALVLAQGTAVLSREQLQALIDESTQALQKLIAARDQPLEAALAFKRDRRGKTPTDDFKENLLQPDVQKKLEAAQMSATSDFRAGDLPGVQIHLGQLRQGLKAEIERYQAITEYWRTPASKPYVEGAARKATLKANGIETPGLAEIESLYSQLDKQVAAADFVTAMGTTWPRLSKLQEQAKNAEYQQLMAKIDSDTLQGFRSATPGRKCSPPEGGLTSGTGEPSTRPDFPPTNEYFPTSMKRQGVRSGTPEVFVVVSAEGCPERAVLVGPSEHAEFDDAGLRIAVDGRYYPAAKDGEPVRAGFYMRVSFFDLS
jgi:hypothetical protein